jgi:hypothetical protein
MASLDQWIRQVVEENLCVKDLCQRLQNYLLSECDQDKTIALFELQLDLLRFMTRHMDVLKVSRNLIL